MEAEKQTKHAFLASDLFTQKQVLGMLAPLILDKLAVYAIMLLTTSMISASGEDSVSAVSLVTPISHLALALFSAFGTGGAVIIAQYKGHGDEEKLKEAIAQTFWLVQGISGFCMMHVTELVIWAIAVIVLHQNSKQTLIAIGISVPVAVLCQIFIPYWA